MNWEDEARVAFGDDAGRMIERIRRDADETMRSSHFAHELGAESIRFQLNAPEEIRGRFTSENLEIVRRLFPLATINGTPSPIFMRPIQEREAR